MNFSSDNVSGAAPELLAAIAGANDGPAAAYGDDPLTRRVEARIAELFECEADVFLVATGTAANALSLSVMAPPFGAVFCHPESHIECDECGCSRILHRRRQLVLLPGADGKLDPAPWRRRSMPPTMGSIMYGPPQSA